MGTPARLFQRIKFRDGKRAHLTVEGSKEIKEVAIAAVPSRLPRVRTLRAYWFGVLVDRVSDLQIADLKTRNLNA